MISEDVGRQGRRHTSVGSFVLGRPVFRIEHDYIKQAKRFSEHRLTAVTLNVTYKQSAELERP